MPTGYTADLTPNSSFRDFAILIARGFGALIHMRDEPMDAPITMPEVSDHHAKGLAKAKERLATLAAMTEDAKKKAALAAYKKAVKDYNKSCDRASEKRTAYRNMLAQVEAWEVPSPDHEGMKADMIRQLTESDKWDNGILDKADRVPKLLTPDEWFAAEMEAANWEHNYHLKSQGEEEQRIAERRRWIEQLYESLPKA